jgi:Tol biopolymer transport system component/DNA-binding winged helix-turn-helix (wHTH) protein
VQCRRAHFLFNSQSSVKSMLRQELGRFCGSLTLTEYLSCASIRAYSARGPRMPSSVRKDAPFPGPRAQRIRFDLFDVDLCSGELRKNGRRIRLQAQPFQLLAMLLEHGGEVVTREEVCRTLWPSDTFVDFDHSLSSAVNKVREALGDSAANPRFVETLPKRGYRFIAEIRPELPESAAPLLAAVKRSATTPKKAMWIGVPIAAALAIFLTFSTLRSRPRPANLTPVPFATLPGTKIAPAISPDGSRVVFAWDGDLQSGGGFDLYVKVIGSETLLRLTKHPSDWLSPTWSPDGTQVAFHRIAGPDTGIYVVPALGGPERKLKSTKVSHNLAALISWSSDGKWIGFGEPLSDKAEDRIFLLSTETLQTRPLPHNPRCLHEATPTFSHGGKELAYVCVFNTNDFELQIMPAMGGSSRRVFAFSDYPAGIAWSPDDRRLILCEAGDRGPGLYEITISDGFSRRLLFESGASLPNVSARTDKLAYSFGSNSTEIWRKDLLHPETFALKLMPSTRAQDGAQYSPDGRHIAFQSTRGGVQSVWMSDADGKNLVQISNLDGYAETPRWSPDSTKLAFDLHHGNRYEIYVVNIEELVPRKLITNIESVSKPSWSHDGRWIYFRSYETIGHKIYRCPATGGDATALAALPNVTSPQEAFDGETLYFAARGGPTDLLEISLKPPFKQSPVEGLPMVDHSTLWTVVAGGIYFVPKENHLSVQYYEFGTRRIREIFKVEKEFGEGLSISRDGQYFVYSLNERRDRDIMLVDHFQ